MQFAPAHHVKVHPHRGNVEYGLPLNDMGLLDERTRQRREHRANRVVVFGPIAGSLLPFVQSVAN